MPLNKDVPPSKAEIQKEYERLYSEHVEAAHRTKNTEEKKVLY